MLDDNETLASFENLRVEFDTKDGKVVAVEDISLRSNLSKLYVWWENLVLGNLFHLFQ